MMADDGEDCMYELARLVSKELAERFEYAIYLAVALISRSPGVHMSISSVRDA